MLQVQRNRGGTEVSSLLEHASRSNKSTWHITACSTTPHLVAFPFPQAVVYGTLKEACTHGSC